MWQSELRDAGNDDAKVKVRARMGATLPVVKSMIKKEHFAKEEKVIEGTTVKMGLGGVKHTCRVGGTMLLVF